ncbi:hypothetical protein [Streptomyces prunicolor]|uniref:hypothetical protein n=1 Tax=Streptomyces prunicolor TaxID=67348 RepID=UPI0033EAEFAA
MELAEIAIVVSSVSALFTASNVAIAYRNYKQVRPKVEVLLEGSGMGPVVRGEGKPRQYVFNLRFANRGNTDIGVESLGVFGNRDRFPCKERFGKFTRFEDPKEVEAFSGIKYEEQIDAPFLTSSGKYPQYVRFVVSLTDGRKAKSRKIRKFPGLELPQLPQRPWWWRWS